MFIETMLGSILTAAAICLKKHHPDLALILLTILLIAANLGTFWMNAKRLGYLETRVNAKHIGRATLVTIGLGSPTKKSVLGGNSWIVVR